MPTVSSVVNLAEPTTVAPVYHTERPASCKHNGIDAAHRVDPSAAAEICAIAFWITPPGGVRSIVMSMSVCLSVCLSVCPLT